MSESLSAKIGENLRLSILRMAETCPDGHEGGQILSRSDKRGSLDSEGLDQLQEIFFVQPEGLGRREAIALGRGSGF